MAERLNPQPLNEGQQAAREALKQTLKEASASPRNETQAQPTGDPDGSHAVNPEQRQDLSASRNLPGFLNINRVLKLDAEKLKGVISPEQEIAKRHEKMFPNRKLKINVNAGNMAILGVLNRINQENKALILRDPSLEAKLVMYNLENAVVVKSGDDTGKLYKETQSYQQQTEISAELKQVIQEKTPILLQQVQNILRQLELSHLNLNLEDQALQMLLEKLGTGMDPELAMKQVMAYVNQEALKIKQEDNQKVTEEKQKAA
jgi:hypothetical protein